MELSELEAKAREALELVRNEASAKLRERNPVASEHYQRIWLLGYEAGFVTAYVNVMQSVGQTAADVVRRVTAPGKN